MSDDILKQEAVRAATKWDRAKVLVMGITIIGTVLGSTYSIGQAVSEMRSEVSQAVKMLTEIKEKQAESDKKHDNTGAILTSFLARLARLEKFEEAITTNTTLFWSKDWADLMSRLERVEKKVLFGDKPEFRER